MNAPSTILTDRFGRRIDYLRLSVTDRCNLRCLYCMPPEGIEHFDRNHILTFEEMERFTQIAATLGVRKIKLTGGEPLIRRGISGFIDSIQSIEGIEDVSITTNGVFLESMACELWEAGLRRINVSLDSLNEERYREITRGGDLRGVLRGIEKVLLLGFRVKINTVVLKDLSDSEALNITEFGRERGIEVRFIEFMPLCGSGWKRNYFLPLSSLKTRIEDRYKLYRIPSDGVAELYRIEGGGTVGFIKTMSDPFCFGCSRLRLTARGGLKPCLFSALEVNIFPLLRKGASNEEIVRAIGKAVYLKPKWNPVLAGEEGADKTFIRNIGG
ncbi:MAG: GTP 3',8-cyclase MoaA [Candidatus Caldarchaeum sp.]